MKAVQAFIRRKSKSRLRKAQSQAREAHRFDYQDNFALVGAELRRLRLEQGYTIVAVARAIKIPKYRLARIEHGLYIHFGIPTLYQLADLYAVTPLDILSVIPNSSFDTLTP